MSRHETMEAEAWTVRDGKPDNECEDGSVFEVMTPDGAWRGCIAVDPEDARERIREEWTAEQTRRAAYDAPAPNTSKDVRPRPLVDELTGALRFIMAFYEPGQTYLDTNAWKVAEAGGWNALAKGEEFLTEQAAIAERETLSPHVEHGEAVGDGNELAERLLRDAEEISGWGAGNEAATVREAAAHINAREAELVALRDKALDEVSSLTIRAEAADKRIETLEAALRVHAQRTEHVDPFIRADAIRARSILSTHSEGQ